MEGEACCLRARRGCGECSGHFHCLQTEERRQQTEAGGKAEESISSVRAGEPLSPCLVGPPCPSAQGESVTPSSTDTSRWVPTTR